MSQPDYSIAEICEQISKGNLVFYSKYLHEDVRWNIIGEEVIIGKNKVIERAGMVELTAYPIISIQSIITDSDKVVVESSGEATLKNGELYQQAYCDIYHFENGKISEYTTFLDTALSKTTRENELRDLILEINQAFRNADLDFLEKHISENVVWEDISGSKILKGKESFLKYCSETRHGNQITELVVLDVLIEREKVVVEFSIETETRVGKQQHSGCDIYHFSGNRFYKLTSYLHTASPSHA